MAMETPTMATQIDSTWLETVIQSAGQASVTAMLKLFVPCSVVRDPGQVLPDTLQKRAGRTRTQSHNRGNRNNDSSRSSPSSSRSRSPHRRRSRSLSRHSCTRSKSHRSSPRTSLGHTWTAAGSSNQPTS